MVRRSAATAALLLAVSLLPAARGASIIINGNFNAGLSGWTPFTTTNGTLGPGLPDVSQFPADSSSSAASFQVGQSTLSRADGNQGGGIYQDVTTTGQSLYVTVNVAAEGGSAGNLYGGVAELLIDTQPVFGYDFGALQAGQIQTATLSYHEVVSAGTHSIGIQFLRPASVDINSPYQFATDFFAADAPEPPTLLIIGVALLLLSRKRFRSRS